MTHRRELCDMENKSCAGCKFLYGSGDGYSDWTWMDTEVTCALNKNPELPTSELYDLPVEKLPQVVNGRCERYSPGEYITISPDGEPDGDFTDAEQEAAIREDRYVRADTIVYDDGFMGTCEPSD